MEKYKRAVANIDHKCLLMTKCFTITRIWSNLVMIILNARYAKVVYLHGHRGTMVGEMWMSMGLVCCSCFGYVRTIVYLHQLAHDQLSMLATY
jgi:hypothetical protein